MTEDVLEQIVDDVLRHRGYFTRTNVRYGPRSGDEGFVALEHNQRSDVDVLAVDLQQGSVDPAQPAVYVVSCKAMQDGFSPQRWLQAADGPTTYRGKHKDNSWKHLRELWSPVWAQSLRSEVRRLTGATSFTYVLAVTRLDPGGSTDIGEFRQHPRIAENLADNDMEVWTLADLWTALVKEVGQEVESSTIGRLAQMLKAAGVAHA